MLVSEIMRRGANVISPLATLESAARVMQAKSIGFLPVCEEGHFLGLLVGVLTDRDIVIRAVATGRDGMFSRVADFMTAPALTCFENEAVEEANARMSAKSIRRLPVLNAAGKVIGILSQARCREVSPSVADTAPGSEPVPA